MNPLSWYMYSQESGDVDEYILLYDVIGALSISP